METIRNQRPATLIGIGIAAVLLVAVVLYMVAFRGPSWETVATTEDAAKADAFAWRLDMEKVKSEVVSAGNGQYEVRVLSSDKDKAKLYVNGGGSSTRANMKSDKACQAPGQFANRSQTEAFEACKREAAIHDAIMSDPSTVMEATVTVVNEDSGAFTGSDTVSKITATVFLNPRAEKPLDAASLASAIANMAPGGSPDNVVIKDSNNNLLWNRGQSETAAAKTAAGGCNLNPSTPITDITAKEQAVKCYIEEDVTKKVAELVGGAERVQVAAGITLSPAAENKTAKEVTRGALLNDNTISNSSGSSTSVNDSKNYSPNTTETSTQKNAGYIDRMSLSVTLDSTYVTPAMENTVRNFLRGYVDPRRGDPMPSVQSTKFASDEKPATGGAKGAPSANAGAGGGSATDSARDAAAAPAAAAALPKGVLVTGFLLLVALVTMVALLWRRSARLAAERQTFEQEFRNEARMFDSFAQNNPDELARQLEEWLGAPPQTPAPTP